MDANTPDPLQIELYLVNDMLDSIVETMDDIERKSNSQSLSQDIYQKQNLFLQPGMSRGSTSDQYLPVSYKRDAHNYYQNVGKLLNNPRLHTVQTSNIRMIKCHLCQKSVNSESALDHYSLHTRQHKDVHKKTSKISTTPLPSANATTRGVQPKQVKFENPRVCRYCFRKFTDQDSFLRHMRKHSGIPSGLFHCTKCYKTFNRAEDHRMHACDSIGLIQHLIKQGSQVDLQDKITTEVSSTPRGDATIRDDDSKVEVICWLCHLVFGTQSELYQHIHLVHEQFKYMLHACSICETFSKNKQTLRKHFQEEHGKESYCEECRQCFDTEREYQIHLAQRGYCGICNDHILNKCLEYQHIPTHLI